MQGVTKIYVKPTITNPNIIVGNSATTGTVAIIERIKAQSYDIVLNDDGTYSRNK